MLEISSLFLFFPLAITLHNLEEALWLPQWSKYAQKFHAPVNKDKFHFAVIVITLLAYLATCTFMFLPQILVCKYFYFGFLGAMIINAIFPHLVSTIILKKYSPGLITGVFLVIPSNVLIITYSIYNKVISFYKIVLSTIVVGTVLLIMIPILFKLGKKFISYE
ncbi:HXXEE domain-containing protein [Tissierella simiarum]|uniref:HXXEE domain-containing protein n=1 Tax=Tissierella simiarum TaxID=2841534 RepID=UPI001FE7BBD3|nr:HXXEE domain-containing protein [Tissierella simiarum]